MYVYVYIYIYIYVCIYIYIIIYIYIVCSNTPHMSHLFVRAMASGGFSFTVIASQVPGSVALVWWCGDRRSEPKGLYPKTPSTEPSEADTQSNRHH